MTTWLNDGGEYKSLPKGGEMGERIRAFDWARSDLGPMAKWPAALLSTLGICLSARFPMAIYWGTEGFLLYNDAWRPILGNKHPLALGQAAKTVWPEIWDTINPLFETVRQTGEGTWRGDELLPMQRFGYTEECYFDYTFNPITGPGGQVEGILNIVQETTFRVLNERRNLLLSTLAANSGMAKTEQGAGKLTVSAIASDPRDIPLALLYVADSRGKNVNLVASSGLAPENLARFGENDVAAQIAQEEFTLDPPASPGKWVTIEGCVEKFGQLPASPWPEQTEKALAFPVGVMGPEDRPVTLVVGVSPRRQLDGDYIRFFELVAAHVASALANARAYEVERRRAETLAELDRAKTTFFSNVSHEFRTPLTLMLGPLEDLLARRKSTPRADDIGELEVVHRNSLRLLKLVNTLLDFSRIEAGRARAMFVETDLAALTTDLASVFRAAMERAGLEFTVDCPPLGQPVFVDRDMWEKIVFNLLSNAFKFTLSGGVEILLRAENGAAVLRVRDTGIGIPVEELPNVFKRFHRIENARGRSHEGTGIGLALASELVKLQGGNIEVESEPGRGTVFLVKLPFGARHLAPESIGATPAPAPSKLPGRVFLEEAASWLTPDALAMPDVSNTDDKGAASKGKAGTVRPRILLAEDNADLRNYICRLLNPQYDVEAVKDGVAALEAARQNPPQLVLSDVMMPRLDGFGLLRALRNDPSTRAIPIILLSARAGEDSVVEGVEAGADDYLTKPFSARELLTRVASHLAMDRMRKEAAENIRQSEEKYRNLFNSLLEGFCIIEMVFDEHETPVDYRFLEVNPSFEQQTGLHSAQGRLIRELVPGQEAHWFEIYGKIALTGEPAQFENEAKALNRWFKVSAFRIGGAGSRKVAVLFNDITSSKQAEALLRQNEGLFSALVNQAPTGVYVVDALFRLQQVNALAMPAFAQVHPRIGRDFSEVMHILWGPDIGGELVKIFRHTLATGVPYVSPRFSEFRQDLGVEKSYEWQTQRVTLPDGQHGVVCYFNDITERTKNEERERQLRALLADKSAHLETLVQERTARLQDTIGELEAFSYSIAHDMRAPLRSLQGFSGILLSDYAENLDAEGRRFLSLIAKSANRMDRLIQDVLNYSRLVRGDYPFTAVEIEPLLRGILDTYPQFADNAAEIVFQGPFPNVLGNEAMITQIFSNLMGNAVKFVLPGTKPRLKVWAEAQEKSVRLHVQDNGIGIAQDQHEKIFGIFQQVNKNYEGTGIGLAIVKKAVERMGGKVGLQSEPGRGSIFWIELRREETREISND